MWPRRAWTRRLAIVGAAMLALAGCGRDGDAGRSTGGGATTSGNADNIVEVVGGRKGHQVAAELVVDGKARWHRVVTPGKRLLIKGSDLPASGEATVRVLAERSCGKDPCPPDDAGEPVVLGEVTIERLRGRRIVAFDRCSTTKKGLACRNASVSTQLL